MGSEPAPDRTRLEPKHPFRELYRQAGRRWLVLLVATTALIWLGYFAGMVRNPGGVKRPWAVVASRAMAAAGGVILVRLLLFSYEERVPVLYVRPDIVGIEALTGLVGWLRARKDAVVPLADVVAFMAERRYVPGGGLALVLEATTLVEAESLASLAGEINFTILMPSGVFKGRQEHVERDIVDGGGQPGIRRLPDSVEIGAVIGPDPEPPGRLRADLRGFADGAKLYLGKSPVCAAAGEETTLDRWSLEESGGYICLLGGTGYNRFGDSPTMVRLLDVSPVLRLGRQTALNMRIYTGIFKGAYVWWPIALLLKALGASPRWQ